MKAMILAAGLGTRLRPLTDRRPKALVEIGGRTLLEIVLSRLRSFGINEVIINVHHFGEMIVDYLKQNNKFGMHIEVSREDVLLDTGGGLKKAAHFFADSKNQNDEAFILHNVDVITTIDLKQMAQFHTQCHALATLAVQDRRTSRYLLFDEQGQLCGRLSASAQKIECQKTELVRSSAHPQPLAFCGVQVISPRLLRMMSEDGIFSIIDAYLRLASAGEAILAFRADEYYWRDLGRIDSVQQVEHDLKQKDLKQKLVL